MEKPNDIFDKMFTCAKQIASRRGFDVFLRVSHQTQEVHVEAVGAKPGEYFAGVGTMYNGESWQLAAIEALKQVLCDFAEDGEDTSCQTDSPMLGSPEMELPQLGDIDGLV